MAIAPTNQVQRDMAQDFNADQGEQYNPSPANVEGSSGTAFGLTNKANAQQLDEPGAASNSGDGNMMAMIKQLLQILMAFLKVLMQVLGQVGGKEGESGANTPGGEDATAEPDAGVADENQNMPVETAESEAS